MNNGYKTASPDSYNILKAFARKNRKEMTESETVLWNGLRNDIKGYYFRRQHIIGDYIADFVCLSKKLIIEVDGGYHEQPLQEKNDQIRTDYLQERGFHIIRFKNEDVNSDLKGVIQKIKEELNRL